MRISIIGTGNVAQALARGFVKSKHKVVFGSRDTSKKEPVPGTKVRTPQEAVREGEVVVLAVPFRSVRETISSIGPSTFAGKTIVDVTNVLGASGEWSVGYTTSGAEEIAKLLPQARVVKAFNTVFVQHMSSGKIGSENLALLVAGDDAEAKETVMRLGKEIGFVPVDAGELSAARYLEPLGLLNIKLGYGQKLGPGIGFRLVRAT